MPDGGCAGTWQRNRDVISTDADTIGEDAMPVALTHSLLSDAQDSYGVLPAVTVDGDEIDFERFTECVEWLAADLRSLGVDTGARVGLGVQGGWALVLAWHALVAVDAIVIPLDLCDVEALRESGSLDVDFVLTHEALDDALEDVITVLADPIAATPVYRVADEFALVEINPLSNVRVGGGGLVADPRTGCVERTPRLLAEADRVGGRLDLWPGARVHLQGALNTRPALLLIIACAARGACACLEATSAS
ncbi:hypothetical protein AAFP30_20595 [Gordonia sp. CPCC 205515]|uniref:hypothetical protein n=1 Tax=Gordonia sp. CPCC 205515 TaxID=3140791 RepID=UPI003AF3BCD1